MTPEVPRRPRKAAQVVGDRRPGGGAESGCVRQEYPGADLLRVVVRRQVDSVAAGKDALIGVAECSHLRQLARACGGSQWPIGRDSIIEALELRIADIDSATTAPNTR